MRLMWESLHRNRANEPKSPTGRDFTEHSNKPGKDNHLREEAERTTYSSSRQRSLRYKLGRLPVRQLKVDRSKGLLLLLPAVGISPSSPNGPSALLLTRGSSLAFLCESDKSGAGTSLVHALDCQQLDANQRFDVIKDAGTTLETVTGPDSGRVFEDYPAIRAYCRLPTRALKICGLRRVSRMAGGKKGRRLKAQGKSNTSLSEDLPEPVVHKVISSSASYLEAEEYQPTCPGHGRGEVKGVSSSQSVVEPASDQLRHKSSETSHVSGGKTGNVEYPVSVNTDSGRIGLQPTCSLSEPDFATMEYNSGWLGDDHALQIASLLSEEFCDESSKEDEEIAVKEFAGLLGDGDMLLVDEVVKDIQVSDSVTLSGSRALTMARHNSRKSTSGNIVLQLENVAGDYGEAYEEMERRITVCNIVGGAILKGMVRAIADEATESVGIKDKEMVGMSKAIKAQDARIADLQNGLRNKEAELATLIKEFQFHERKYVGDLIREKEVVVQKSIEKENCLAKKERELTELAHNMVHLSLQLDAESKKVTMLEKQMKDLRDAQALKVREIANLIEETERMKYDKESALEMVQRESRLRELRVKEALDHLLGNKEEEVECLKGEKLDHLDKISTLESVERGLRQELSTSNKRIVALEKSKDEGLRTIDCLSREIQELETQHEKLSVNLEELLRQMDSRDEYVLQLKDQARIGSQECSIILDLWNGKMVDILKMFRTISKEVEQDEKDWAGKLSDQAKVLDETLQELDAAQDVRGELNQRILALEAERDTLVHKVAELSDNLLDKSKVLDETLGELAEVRDVKSTMEQEILHLKLEAISLTEQLNRQGREREMEAQENALNVQELERLQDMNGSMATELLQLKCAIATLKSNLDKQSEMLDETRRCWTEDKTTQSLILEDNRKELASLRKIRETLEENLKITSSDNTFLRQMLEKQRIEWEDEEGRLGKEHASHLRLLDEKSIELVGLRFLKDDLEHKLCKAEQEKLASLDTIGQLKIALEDKFAAHDKLQNDFHTFVENMGRVHQKAFEHGLHLETFEDDMKWEQWRLEMELEIVAAYFGSSLEDVLVQADVLAANHTSVVEQLASCLNELDERRMALDKQATEIEDVQASNMKLSEMSNHLCTEIESCNEEISRCKVAFGEAASRAEKSKADYVCLQKKMVDVKLGLEGKLYAQGSEIAQLKRKLEDVELQARENDWKYEAESSLILHAVDVWRDHMKEAVAGYTEELSVKDEWIAELNLQLESSSHIVDVATQCDLGNQISDAIVEDLQKDSEHNTDIESTLGFEADILTVIFEDKARELAMLLNTSRQELVDLGEGGKAQDAQDSENGQGDGQLVGSCFMDRGIGTDEVDREASVDGIDDLISSKINNFEEEMKQMLIHMDLKLTEMKEQIQEESWTKALEVGIVAHLLGLHDDVILRGLDGSNWSSALDICLDTDQKETDLPFTQMHTVMHEDNNATLHLGKVRTALAHDVNTESNAGDRIVSGCFAGCSVIVAGDEVACDSRSRASVSESLRGPSMDSPNRVVEQQTEWVHRSAEDDTILLWDKMFDENFEGGLLEEDELRKLVQRNSGQTSMSGLEDEARLKVQNNSLVSYLKAKMYAWSREKDMVIAEKTEQLYKLKRELLNEREKERAEIIGRKEREVEAMRAELARKEQEEALLLEQGNLERDMTLAKLKNDWDAEKARLLDLVHATERDKNQTISQLEEEYRSVRLDLEHVVAEKNSKILTLSEELAELSVREAASVARIEELTQELATLRNERDEQIMLHRDDKTKLQDLEEKEKALQVATENLQTERSNRAAMEADLHDLQVSTNSSVKALDVELRQVTSELREERSKKEKLGSELQSCKREISLLNRESALNRKQLESDLAEHLNQIDRACQVLETDVSGKIRQHTSRLEGAHKQVKILRGELSTLADKERRKVQICLRNLQTAEEEVDALGDEVESLLVVLEKVDVVLAQYSPVFQLYPGMMDLVKLVRQAVLQRMDSSWSDSKIPDSKV